MAALNELIERVENPELREQIQAAVNKLIKQKKFGLVFEEHLPECTPLYEIPVRKGSKAALKSGKVSDFYTVLKIEGDNAFCLNKDRTETTVYPVSDLVSVAEFGDPIYPYLQPIDSVCKAPESDLWHTLIEADNYHALQLLEYLYAGKVDCIYIDPPYNTGARDWKYNDNYVESADAYRHSKWLSMMKKRLVLAHNILSSKGCIFISIDDNEVYTLKLLCDEIFGTNSFCALIPWRKRTAKSDVPFGVSQDYEYVLCYANKDFKAGIKNISRKYFETDDYKGRPWRYHDLTKQTTIQERPNSNFPMINPKSGDVFPVNPLRSWAITKESFQEYYDSGRIIFPGDYDFLNIKRPVLRYWKDDDEKKAGEDFGISSTSTFLPTEIVGMTQNGTKEIVGIFGDKIFSFPAFFKPKGITR